MTGSSAMLMFAALLDRSVAQIGELTADGRYFDRQAVAGVADVWDNNTMPLFETVLSRPGWLRERRARAALVWMAAPTPSRRTWMIEQAAIAGHRLEPLLPLFDHVVHYRDYQGQVRPGVVPLTTTAVASVVQNYDLTRAEVRTVRVERAGQALSGYVALTAPRRYAASEGHEDAVVQLFLDDVRAVRFDSDDAAGATVAADPDVVEIRVGTQGHLRAASATVGFDDPSWHLSYAGRAADADTPDRSAGRRMPRQIKGAPVRGGASDAAMVLHQAMLEIRSVRYSHVVGRVSLRELGDALAGAGTRVLTATSKPRGVRDQAFRKLAEEWFSRSPSLAHRIVDRFPADHWARRVVPTGPRQPTMVDLPAQAQLTLAAYTAAHTEFGKLRDASAVVNLAVPGSDGRWGLRAMKFPRSARLSLRTAALTAPHALSYTAGVSLSLGNGPFIVTGPNPTTTAADRV